MEDFFSGLTSVLEQAVSDPTALDDYAVSEATMRLLLSNYCSIHNIDNNTVKISNIQGSCNSCAWAFCEIATSLKKMKMKYFCRFKFILNLKNIILH
jgi:hypothetical protein